MNFALWSKKLHLHNPLWPAHVFLKKTRLYFPLLFLFHFDNQNRRYNIKQGHLHFAAECNGAVLICGCHVILIKSVKGTWRSHTHAYLGSSDLCSIYDALVKVFTESWKDVFKIEMSHTEEWVKEWKALMPRSHAHTRAPIMSTFSNGNRLFLQPGRHVVMLLCYLNVNMQAVLKSDGHLRSERMREFPFAFLFFISLCS